MKTLNEREVLQQVSFTGKYLNLDTYEIFTEKKDCYSEMILLINGVEYVTYNGRSSAIGFINFYRKLKDVIIEHDNKNNKNNLFSSVDYEINNLFVKNLG